MKLNSVFLFYVGRLFVARFAFLLLFFVVLLQMLDLLNESDRILAAEGADWRSIAKYISLRAPQLASQFAPFAGLLAIVLTLTMLNLTSEITIMRAAGMSVHRVLYPIGLVCGFSAAAHFVFHEVAVVEATEKLAYWEANDYQTDLPPDDGTRTNVKIKVGDEIIHIGSAAMEGGRAILRNVVIYDLDADGLAQAVTEARGAIFADGAWTLRSPQALNAETATAIRNGDQTWRTDLDPETLFAMSLNADRTPLAQLVRQIGQLRQDGADTSAAMTALLSRFSKPMAILVMPLFGAIAGFGVSRQGNQLARAVAGATLGFAYFVAENLMIALGKLSVVPAMIGAFFPFALFMVVGFTIVLSMEN